MEDENDLSMSLFNSDLDLELNLDEVILPEDSEEEEGNQENNQEENISEKDNTDSEQENNNLNEDESSEEVVEEEDTEEGGSSDDEISPNIYSSFASVLSEQGLVPSLDLQNKEIKTIDDLTSIIKEEISSQSKQYLVNKIGEKGYEALEKGVSLSEYQQYQENIQTLDSITEDTLEKDIELSKKIILQDYINQGMDQNRAMRLLKKSIDLGEDVIIEDAKESLSSLHKLEELRLAKLSEQKQQEAAAEQARQEKIDNDLKNAIYNKSEIIKDLQLNKAIQDKVYKSITNIVGKSPEGVLENQLMKDRRENPIEFDTKLYYLYEITNGFSDFSKITRKANSKATSNLEKALRSNKFEDSGNPSFVDDKESYGGIFGTELNI